MHLSSAMTSLFSRCLIGQPTTMGPGVPAKEINTTRHLEYLHKIKQIHNDHLIKIKKNKQINKYPDQTIHYELANDEDKKNR